MLRVLVYGLNVFVRGSWRACICVCVCAGEEEEVGTVGRNIGGGSHDAIALASCSRSPPFFQASPLVTRMCRPLRRDERGIR